jgi:2'-5' RNA ligase
MPTKTHHTAVAVVPPEEMWEPIQTIRRQYDRQIRRWMPHINLLYPFLPLSQWDEILPQLIRAAQQVTPFQVNLARFHAFTHSSGSATVWLAPEPGASFRQLQTTLQATVPICDEQSRFANGFTPHLSVGQVRSRAQARSLIDTLQASWQPLAFSLDAIALLCRDGDQPFRVERRVPLGIT